jgi:hypothetical protein
MKHLIAMFAILASAGAGAAEFFCSNTKQVQIAQLPEGYETAAATSSRGRQGKDKIDRYDVLQAYRGQPVLVGPTWLIACMVDPKHPDSKAAFSGLIGIRPETSAKLARGAGLVDRGIRLTHDMSMCLIENAPAVGYSAIPLETRGVKPCF